MSWRTKKIATNRINVNRIKGNKASRVIRTVSLDNGNQARTRRTSRTLSKTLTGDSRAGPQGKMMTARAKVDSGDNRVASGAADETPKVAKISTSARRVSSGVDTAVRRCGSHPSRSAGRASFELTAQTEGRGNAPALALAGVVSGVS